MVDVGNTPLIKVDEIYAKLEGENPLGSIKDRIAEYIIEKSREQGLLQPRQTIIEASSGNTGIALSYFGNKFGHPVIIVMPEDMTSKRKELIRSYGADLIECSAGDFAQAAQIRDNLAQEKGYFNPDQFSNPFNVDCHRETTGKEILEQMSKYTQRSIDAFVAGVGTGGTLIGVGEALRERYPNVCLSAVEPLESAVMSGGNAASHYIQGIGDGFIPTIASDGQGGLNPLINRIITVSSEVALDAAKMLARKYKLHVGISSGANYIAAKTLQQEGYQTIVTVFPDSASRYRCMGLGE